MGTVLIIVNKVSYGYEDTFSAFYVAMVCFNKGIDADVLLTGEGIYAAINGQTPFGSVNYPKVGELFYLIFPEGNIYVPLESMVERGIKEDVLVETFQIIKN